MRKRVEWTNLLTSGAWGVLNLSRIVESLVHSPETKKCIIKKLYYLQYILN